MKKKRGNLKTIWFFLKPYKGILTFLLLLAVIIGILETMNIAVLYPLLTLGFNIQSEQNSNPLLILIDNLVKMVPINDAVITYGILFIILVVLAFVLGIIYAFTSAKVAAQVVGDNQRKIFDKYINSDYQFFIDNKQGNLLYNSSRAPGYIGPITNILSQFAAELILLISVIVLLFSISWIGTILVIGGAIGYYALTRYLSSKVSYMTGTGMYQAGQRQGVILNEFLTGVKQIKISQAFPYWRTQFGEAVSNFWQLWTKYILWLRAPSLMLNLLLFSSVAIIVIIVKIQNPVGFVSLIPAFGTFAFAILKVLPKVANFGTYQMEIMNALPNLELVSKLLSDDRYSTTQKGNKDLRGFNSNIEFKNVKFAHKARSPVLNNVSLRIEKNKTVAVLGASGSGKSTILNLLLQLYDMDKGDIYIDNVSIKEYKISSILEKIGFVDQETFIYNASIKDNITFGNKYTMPEIIEAAKLAYAHEFIQQLPQGYDTLVGDRGVKLSGGEKQRIAIARAMIRKPEILILDEATSSLDSASENIVREAINKAAKNCTTLIIAHRLSTIKNADIIYVLDQGKITESGTHDQLMNQKGKYWELYNTQVELNSSGY